MKFNIAVVEDNIDAAATLEKYLERYSGENKDIEFNVSVFSNAVKFMSERYGNFDIVFMDIELPDGNGMEIVRKMREGGNDTIVIFVTNLAQYAVSGYEVHAFDFVVKPVAYGNFSIKLDNAVSYFVSKQNRYVWVVNREGKTRISTSDIKYVEIRSHTTVYHTKNGVISSTATGSLSELEKKLDDPSFALCNRCFLVNLRFVTSVRDMSVFVDGEELQIARPRRASFMKAFTNFCARSV